MYLYSIAGYVCRYYVSRDALHVCTMGSMPELLFLANTIYVIIALRIRISTQRARKKYYDYYCMWVFVLVCRSGSIYYELRWFCLVCGGHLHIYSVYIKHTYLPIILWWLREAAAVVWCCVGGLGSFWCIGADVLMRF